jgi:hypothetical protein
MKNKKLMRKKERSGEEAEDIYSQKKLRVVFFV